MNILVTSAGQRVSLVRAFQKEVRLFNEKSKVFTTDMYPHLSAACNVSDYSFTSGRFTDPEYISEILNICMKNEVSMLIPTIDTELLLLAKNKSIFEANGVHVIIADDPFVSICRDKRKTNQYFKDHSINIPQTIDKREPSFPLFIKPIDGSSSNDTYIIKGREQLTEYHLNNDRLMFMEYISKEHYDEFTVDMYYGRDNLIKCIVPRKRIRVRAGEVNKALTCKNRIIPFLRERLNHIEGAIGCITLQLFMSGENTNIFGIEINPRFGGGYPLSYIAGANFPKWLIHEYFLDKELTYTENWEADLLMLRYDDEIIIHDFKY